MPATKLPPIDHLVDDVAVDRRVHRLAELLVRHHRVVAGDVELDVDVAEPGDVDHLDRVVALEPFEVVGRDALDDVEFAGEEVVQPHGRIGHRPVDDLVEVDRVLVPVVGELLDGDVVLDDPLLELVRAGADRGIGEGVGVDRLDRGRRHHHPGAVGELGEERREGLAEDELGGLVVDRLDALDRADVALACRFLKREGALDVELHRLGIERRAVMEDDARAGA